MLANELDSVFREVPDEILYVLGLTVTSEINFKSIAIILGTATNDPLLLPTIITHYYYPLLLPTIITHYYYPLLLPTIITHYYYPLLLPTIITHYCYPLLLPPIITHYYYPRLLPTIITHDYYPLLLPTIITHLASEGISSRLLVSESQHSEK